MWKNITPSACETYHVNGQGSPAYNDRFEQVLAFHAPGLAPVKMQNKAWHITFDGLPAYTARFQNTFGFYCGVAAVVNDNKQCFHILPSSIAIYQQRYDWVGNYQSNLCTVRDFNGDYFHINLEGKSISDKKWSYCGDFRDGIAVVQNDAGLSSHICSNGEHLHHHWFDDLDVFHKGYARAKFSDGWAHVNKAGNAVYKKRYAMIEPFYNGFARVEKANGTRYIIDEQGITIKKIRLSNQNYFGDLSNDLVGFWRTFTIGAAVELGIFEALPDKIDSLTNNLTLQKDRLYRLLQALGELGLVSKIGELWSLTTKGKLLTKQHPQSLMDAATEYKGDLLERWKALPEIIKGVPILQDIFSSVADNKERLTSHHRMLQSYALHDYIDFMPHLKIDVNEIVIDAAGGNGTLTKMLANKFPAARIIVSDISAVVNNITNIPADNKQAFDLFKPWSTKAHHIFLARVLHDWNTPQANEILNNAMNALLPNGKIYIVEMILPTESFSGSLCDLHLLTVTGGQERTYKQYESLLLKAGLRIKNQIKTSSIVSMLITTRLEDE